MRARLRKRGPPGRGLGANRRRGLPRAAVAGITEGMEPIPNHDAFVHLRVLIGVVAGLALTRLMTALARFVQHPGRSRPPALWLGWVFFLLIAILHFWWFEFALSELRWTFELYAFVVFYAALHFFICALLTPDSLDDFAALSDWFAARRAWFFSLLAALMLTDIVDSALKGGDHLAWLGPSYLARQGLLAAGALVAARWRIPSFDAALLAAALGSEIVLIVSKFGSFD